MPRPVCHDNDGHVDDLLSTLMLWLSPEIELQAVTVSDGDCYVLPSYEAILKMATFLNLEGAEIGYSEDPVVNAFPENWRRESYVISELPIFSDNILKKPYQAARVRKTQALLTDCLSHSRQPVTLVTTGPLTNIAPIFEEHPELAANVEELVMMGGAINVPGNVDQPDHDGTAEWNIFADPPAAKAVLDTNIPIRLVPLDVTNQMPITREFLQRLDTQSSKYHASLLAAKLYSLVKGLHYYFWDTLTAAAVIAPELFTFKEARIDVITGGRSAGRTAPVFFGGRKVRYASAVNREGFEALVLEILSHQ